MQTDRQTHTLTHTDIDRSREREIDISIRQHTEEHMHAWGALKPEGWGLAQGVVDIVQGEV